VLTGPIDVVEDGQQLPEDPAHGSGPDELTVALDAATARLATDKETAEALRERLATATKRLARLNRVGMPNPLRLNPLRENWPVATVSPP
jgi:hypothetical protein